MAADSTTTTLKYIFGGLALAGAGVGLYYAMRPRQRLPKSAQGRDLELAPGAVTGFYVCRVGSSSGFSLQTPGGLEIVPAPRPSASMDHIIGSGFEEIREFRRQVEATDKWRDLFVATSPSRSADKSNVLLIGPQGCGKTEAMRAVGADPSNITIFAQGSDFLTCWAGEAQKNPKRLFEAAVKLRKESGKHVFILIDEIDQVLTAGTDSMNLTREFQILMDGIVNYSGISVWGATNHPERIPTPMVRRFHKALIVGKLDTRDRMQLLRHFCGFMPVRGVDEAKWQQLAERLDGATGDVIRKIVDPIWREKMQAFIDTDPERAEALVQWLRQGGGGKFDVTRFDDARRKEFCALLGEHVVIEPKDLDSSIDQALSNLNIRREIITARETYATAEALLCDLRMEDARSESREETS